MDYDFEDDFDEQAYLARYPDIAAAVASGDWPTGRAHYDKHGRAEGRGGSASFDQSFYLASYPVAAREIAAGLASDPRDHYRRFGKHRGFLPTLTAERPANAANLPEFGGFWVDRPDALDAVEGRLETGRINADEAAQLRFWIENGFLIIPNAIPPDLIDGARHELEQAYRGVFPDLLFECGALGRGHMSWHRKLNEHPTKALDLHCFSNTIRNLIFATRITNFLGLIFESRAFASQSLCFLRGSAQEPHQDSAYVAYTIPRQFAASWIALEDVTIGGGELFYYNGSHHWPDFIYGGKHKSVSEAERLGPKDRLDTEIPGHVGLLAQRAAELGQQKSVFVAKAGDALIWHADLVHGGNPISSKVTRKSVVTHYCPKRLAPLFAERARTALMEHQGHYYTTSHTNYAGG